MRLRTRHAGAAVALALALVAATYAAQTATDVGDSFTTGGQAGDVAADSVTARNVNNQGDGHRFVLQDNQARCAGGANDGLACPGGAGDCSGGTCVTPTPVAGTANQLKIYDDDVTATEAWTLALGTTEYPLSRILLDVEEGGSQICDNATTINFSALFSVTTSDGGLTCDVAPGTTIVTTSDGNIAKVDLPSAVAYEDEANVFTAAQTVRPSLLVEQSGGTDILDCGAASTTSCRYTGSYSDADDVATKGDVDSVKGGLTFHAAYINASMSNLATRRFLLQGHPTGGLAGSILAPVPKACTVNKLCATKRPSAVPTGNTVEVRIRKNNSDTGQIGCDITAGTNECCMSSGSLAFTVSGNNPDEYHFAMQCVNAGSACTDATTTENVRAVAFCEYQ